MAVSLSPFAGAGWQFFDNNGVILSGGKLYVYAAGTTSAATTYTSVTGSTANTNPIILNSSGRLANEIWLTTGLNYKFILKTSADVLIGTWDNIPAGTTDVADLQAALASSTGAGMIGYTQGSANAVATTVQTKLRETVSVFDFMPAEQVAYIKAGNIASQNGAAVTAAIQAAITAASTGSVIYFPFGTYAVSTTISIPKKLVLAGAPANSRGTQSAVIYWVGENGSAWATGPKIFTVAQAINGLGTTFVGLGFYTEKSYVTMIDGTATYNLLIQECQFASNQYNKAIELKESAPSASDGAYWTHIDGCNFSNTWVSVADDSNATRITNNNFWAEIVNLAGSSLYITGDINAIFIENNSFEGTWDSTTYAVSIDLVSNLVFTNNRIENYTGQSAQFSRLLNSNLIQGNLFNTAPAFGGARDTTAYNIGQSITEFANWYPNRTTNKFVETSSLGGVFPGKNVLVQSPISQWNKTNLSAAMVQTGATGLRCPVIRLHTPTSGTSYAYQDENILSTPEMQLAVQNAQFVTLVAVVKAKSTNVSTSIVYLNTGDTIEYVTIPKDDKWHVIRLSRRLYTTDTTLYPTINLSYASSYNAADELWIGGWGVYMGTGSFNIPFFDGWTTDPSSASNTGYWQIGEIARNVSPATGQPQGWVCTSTGAPGTWKPLANIA